MGEEQKRQDELLNVTDYLEAVSVFKAMKNFSFAIILLCLLLLGGAFWLVDQTYTAENQSCTDCGGLSDATLNIPLGLATEKVHKFTPKVTVSGAAQDANKSNQPAEANMAALKTSTQAEVVWKTQRFFKLKFSYLAWVIKTCNFILVFAGAIYCLTLLFSLKVSLIGRLGGISHISRAFFRSMFALVFILPWQQLFNGVICGAIYTPHELLCGVCTAESAGPVGVVFYYARFVGWWSVIVLLYISSQYSTGRWAKASLRRLGIV
jgi:hypothetical protein